MNHRTVASKVAADLGGTPRMVGRNTQGRAKTQQGFTLPELLVFLILLTLVSTLGLPRILEPQSEANEEAAVYYLEMLAGAQRAWTEETGTHGSLWDLSAYPPPLPDPQQTNTRLPLMPYGMRPSDSGIAMRVGYYFRQGIAPNGEIVGCWAWPKLRGYSGERTFWLNYETQEVYLSSECYEALPGPPAYADDELLAAMSPY